MTGPGGVRALVTRGAGYQAAVQAVALGSGLVMALVLSRHLGVEGFGGFNYLFAFIYFFLALNDLGVNMIVVREISQAPHRAAELVGGMLSFRALLAVASLVLAWLAIALMRFPAELAISLALFALILPLNALRLPSVILQTQFRFREGAFADIVTRLAGLAFVLVAVGSGATLIGVTVSLVVAEILGTLVTLTLARRFVAVRWSIDVALWRSVLTAALPLGLSTLLTALVNRLDFLMLERMVGLDDVGLYGAAYRVTSVLERYPQLLLITLYPVMAHRAASDPAGLRRMYRASTRHFAAVGLAIAAVVGWFASDLLGLLFGTEFAPAAPGLQWLLLATVGIYAAISGGNVLIATGRQRLSLLILAVAVVLNVVLNLLWIPGRGFVGAAMATAATYALILVWTIAGVERALAEPAPAVAPGAQPAP